MGKSNKDKIKQYIKDCRPLKLKKFVKKHRIDLTHIKLKKQQSLLHYCCKHGNEVILRYLIEFGLDPFLQDSEGNVPLHLSLKQSIQNPEIDTVYTELILPQLEQFPNLLNVKNENGISCRTLLDKLVEKKSPTSQNDLAEEDSDEDWTQKLAEEFQYEHEEAWGHSCMGGGLMDDDYEDETHNEWADRMNREFHQKRKYSQTKYFEQGSSKKRKYPKPEEKEQSEEAEKLEKAREEMRKKYEKHQKEAKESMIQRKRLQYEERFKLLYSKEQKNNIGYDDIPWLFKDDVKEIQNLLFCGASISTLSNKEFYRKYIREQKFRWHPDKFVQKLGHLIKDKDREKILEKVKVISQELNKLSGEL